jgi:hypothetical protein
MCDTKKCTKCGEELPLDQFHKKKYKSGSVGYKSWCKNCARIRRARWYKNNTEKAKASNARWRKDNPEKVRAIDSNYEKNRRAIDPTYKLVRNIRRAIRKAIKRNTKSNHTTELLGCSIKYLRQHLEDQFVEGMNWDNYNTNGWHIDHIIPLDYFDFSDPDQQKRAWHYTNLRPLWASDNIKKGNKIEERQLILL